MSGTAEHTVELAEGNRTLRGLIREILEQEGFDCVDGSESLADLLIVDVDSGDEIGAARRAAYRDADRPVLLCGLPNSRGDDEGAVWVDRPFNASDLIGGCREALGLETDPAPESSPDPTEPSTTREVSYDSAEMEAQLGDLEVFAEEGADDEGERDDAEATEASEILEIDDASSMVVDVQDLHEHFANSGSVSGDIETRHLDVDHLREEARELDPVTGFLDDDSRTNPTVPDVPSGGESEESSLSEPSSGVGRADSTSNPNPGAADSTDARRDVSGGSGAMERDVVDAHVPSGVADGGSSAASTSAELPTAGAADPGEPPGSSPTTSEFRRDLAELATLVANSWNRIGLTARWEDRAERLERTFEALLDDGVSGASDELERVPPAHGFSGTIDVFPTFDLVDLIRSRGLLGRLEVSNESGGFVLYFDGPRLVGVDDLEGRSESMLLDCLRQAESVDDQVYDEMRRSLDDSLAAPLEMRLRSDNLVTDSQLLDARRTRAKWVLKEILGTHTGNFAFVHGNDESGQPWPVNELGLQVDLLALELVREGAIESPVVDYGLKTTFVTVRERMREVGDELLAPVEKDVLDYCIQPAAVRELTDVLEAPEPEVQAAIERLEAVGFLTKLGKQFTNVDKMFEFDDSDPNVDSQMGPDQ